MRVVIAEDAALLREGLAALLEDAGYEVLARVGDGDSLLAVVAEHEPDLAIIDVRMPPTFRDEGIVAATAIRSRYPGTGVLVLSQHVETANAVELVRSGAGFGYLLKDRILDVDDFLEATRRVARGGSALDPEVVRSLVTSTRPSPVDSLSPREAEVLGLMAEGRTNGGIAKRLWVNERTVEAHVRSIMNKLALPVTADDHRRVLAVVEYLRSS